MPSIFFVPKFMCYQQQTNRSKAIIACLWGVGLWLGLFALPNMVANAAPKLICKTKDVYRVIPANEPAKSDSLAAIEKCIYDKKGRLIRQWTSGLQSPVVYYYDYNQQEQLGRTVARTQNGGLLMLWLYQYDKKGRKKEESQIVGLDYEVCTEYFYDNTHNRLQFRRTTVNGNMEKSTFVRQTFAGQSAQVLQETATDALGEIQYISQNVYNEKGLLLKVQSLEPDGKLRQQIEYAYTNADSIATKIVSKGDLQERKTEYAYNTQQQLTDKSDFRFENGQWNLMQKIHYNYTSMGEVAEQLVYVQQKSIPDNKLMYLYSYYK